MREDILSQLGSARGPKIVIEASKRIRHQYQCWVWANTVCTRSLPSSVERRSLK